MLDAIIHVMSFQQVSYLGSSSNYVTLLLSGTLIKHGVNEVLTDKKEGTNKKTLIDLNQMQRILEEIYDLVETIETDESLTSFEALQIATKVQYNRIFADAYMVDKGGYTPVALEKIAMELDNLQSAVHRLSL